MPGRLRLGVTGALLARGFFSLLALLVTIAASIVLARKLPPGDYAAYQSLTKRAMWIATIPMLLLGDWLYRYAAQRIPGTWEAFRRLVIAAAGWSLLVAIASTYYLGLRSPHIILLASASLAAMTVYLFYRAIASALRPVRFTLVMLAYRFTYTTLVIALVYTAAMRLAGALASAAAASAVAVLMYEKLLSKAKPPPGDAWRVLRDWLRHIRPQLFFTTATILASLDAFIAIHVAGETLVAGFFAAGVAATLAREAAASGMGYISAAMLAGGSRRGFHRAFEAIAIIVAPFVALAALYPEHVMSLVNPSYSWASAAEFVAAISAYIMVYEAYTFNLASGIARGEARDAAPLLERLALGRLTVNVCYTLLLPPALALTGGDKPAAALAWMTLFTLASAARAYTFTLTLRGELKEEALKPLPVATAALVASLAAAAPFKLVAPEPKPTFFSELASFTPTALAALAASYLAMLALPPTRERLTALARAAARRLPYTAV